MFDYITHKSTQTDTIQKTKTLVGYEQLLKRKALNTAELLILVSFFNFDEFRETNVTQKKLASFIEHNIIVTGHNIKTHHIGLEELSRLFGSICESKIMNG